MAQFLIPLAMGIPSLISGIMDAVQSGKKLHGGQLRILHRLRHHPRYGGKVRMILKHHHMSARRGGRVRRLPHRRRGRGIASDIVGAIPVVGSILGPLIRAFGGKLRHRKIRHVRGRGLVPMHVYQPIACGGGLLGPGMYRPPTFGNIMSVIPYGHSITQPFGKGFTYGPRGGLLSPTGMGGAVSYRKGHYKHVNGRRVHVAATMVHHGGRVRRVYRRRKY